MARVNAVSFHEHRGLEEICRTIVAAGFDSMEVSRPPFFDRLVTSGTRRAFACWTQSIGLSLYGFDAWVEMQPYVAREQTLEGFRQAIDFAADLDLGQIITHDGFGPTWQGRSAADCLSVLIPLFREICDLAAARDLKVVLEPHPDTLTMDNSFAIDLVDGVDRPNVGLVFDSCHYGVGQPATYLRAIEALGRRIRHVHFADGDLETYALHLPLGEGKVDREGVIAALKAIGFSGTLTNDLYGYPMIEDGARRNAPLVREVEERLGLAGR